MLSHHLPHFIGHISTLGRHAFMYGHAGTRALLGTVLRLQSPRDAFRVALRQSRFSVDGKQLSARKKLPLFIHYHIFKNAGSSFEWALERAFPKRFRQFDSSDPRGVVSARQIARLVRSEPNLYAISSHQATPPPPRILGRQVITSILIRDPIARIGSIYAFERAQQANTPGAVKAKELDFKRYVEWRLKATPSALCNFQVLVCSGRHRTVCSKRDFEAAVIRLDSIHIVGTVARYEEWMALAQWHLQQHFPDLSFTSVHHNRSRTGGIESEAHVFTRLTEDLGAELTSELLSRNELDMTLHQIADSLLTRRLAEREIAVKLRENYRRAAGVTTER